MGNLCAGPPGSDDVVQFDNVRVPAAAAAAAAASDGGPPSNYERKRRPSQSHAAVAEANPTVSSVDALAEISEALKSMPFFDDVASLMTPQNLQRLALLFVRQEFKRDQVIINEGQRDECFHLIVSGKVRVSACVGDFHIDLCDLSVSQWFGDSALCNDQMQPVTVRALQSTSVLSLARRQFTNFIQSCPGASSATLRLTDADANINLQDMPFFRDIPLHTLSQLKVMFEFRRYPVGSYICRQGDKGDGFYLVARGRVAVSVTSADGQELVVATLSAGEW
jgi:CRP-like cAMP-binding protein